MTHSVQFVGMKQFHVEQLEKQPRQQIFKDPLSDRAMAAMLGGPATACLLDGACVAVAGLIDETHGRARAWAIVGAAMPRALWPAVIVEMRKAIEAALHPETGWAHRVWAETIYDWPEGHKLLLHLGMSFEGFSRGGLPNGLHGVVYARCRPDVQQLPIRCRSLLQVIERCLWEDTMSGAVPWAVEEARRAQRFDAHGSRRVQGGA